MILLRMLIVWFVNVTRVQPWLKLSKEACLICEWVWITEHILIRYFVSDADDCVSGPVSYSSSRT